MKDTPNKSMGIGSLGSPSITFVRQFRWTLGSPTLPEGFVRSVNFDFVKKHLHLEYIEVYSPDFTGEPLQDWLDGPYQQDILTFTTYDGCGKALYEQFFTGLEVVADTASFDYSVSDVSVRKLTIKYDNTRRKNVIAFPRDPEVIKDARNVSLDYLNSKLTVPI
jgi:hypothetical protein